MEVERTVYHQWPREEPPAGASVWVNGIGHLQGFGYSRRKLLRHEFIPHLVISGRGTYICQEQTIKLQGGDLFTVWPGLAYEFFEDPQAPWQFYWFHLRGNGAEKFARVCGWAPEGLALRPARPGLLREDLRAMFEYYRRPPQFRNHCQALSMLYKFAADLGGKDRPEPELIDGNPERDTLVREAMGLAETLLDRGINVGEMASQLHVSRNTLLTAFHERLGLAPQDYLAELRLRRAKDLLQGTDWKLAAIAEACGFRHEKYFLRVFKQREGVSPTAWRKAQ